MLRERKMLLLSSTLLVSSVLSSCDNETMGAMFGETRTLPEGAEVDFSHRHAPILNNQIGASSSNDGANNSGAAITQVSHKAPSGNFSNVSGSATDSGMQEANISGRHVPIENLTLATDTNVHSTVQEANISGRHVPIENLALLTNSPEPSVMKVPVVAVTASALPSSSNTAPTSSVTDVVVPAPSLNANTSASQTVAIVQAPVTTQVQSAANNTESHSSFGAWLHHVFSADRNANGGSKTDTIASSKLPTESERIVSAPSILPAAPSTSDSASTKAGASETASALQVSQPMPEISDLHVVASQPTDNASSTPVAGSATVPVAAPAQSAANNTESHSSFGAWLHHVFSADKNANGSNTKDTIVAGKMPIGENVLPLSSSSATVPLTSASTQSIEPNSETASETPTSQAPQPVPEISDLHVVASQPTDNASESERVVSAPSILPAAPSTSDSALTKAGASETASATPTSGMAITPHIDLLDTAPPVASDLPVGLALPAPMASTSVATPPIMPTSSVVSADTSVHSAAADTDSSYPALATVPPSPKRPDKTQTQAEFNSLVSDRGQSESGRKDLMNNTNATVMTSPQTGQLLDNPADVVAPVASATIAPSVIPSSVIPSSVIPSSVIPSSVNPGSVVQPASVPVQQDTKDSNGNKNFNDWFRHLFSLGNKDTTTKKTSTGDTASGAVVHDTVAASANTVTVPATIQPADASQNMATVNSVSTASNTAFSTPAEVVPLSSPETSVAPVAAVTGTLLPLVPAAPNASASDSNASPVLPASAVLEPVNLHPPIESTANTSALPDVSLLSNAQEEPVNLAPSQPSSQAHYLADSRYAGYHVSPATIDGGSN